MNCAFLSSFCLKKEKIINELFTAKLNSYNRIIKIKSGREQRKKKGSSQCFYVVVVAEFLVSLAICMSIILLINMFHRSLEMEIIQDFPLSVIGFFQPSSRLEAIFDIEFLS